MQTADAGQSASNSVVARMSAGASARSSSSYPLSAKNAAAVVVRRYSVSTPDARASASSASQSAVPYPSPAPTPRRRRNGGVRRTRTPRRRRRRLRPGRRPRLRTPRRSSPVSTARPARATRSPPVAPRRTRGSPPPPGASPSAPACERVSIRRDKCVVRGSRTERSESGTFEASYRLRHSASNPGSPFSTNASTSRSPHSVGSHVRPRWPPAVLMVN